MYSMPAQRIYTDENGDSQFEEIEIQLPRENPLENPGDLQYLSEPIDVQAISFSEIAGGVVMGWHPGSRHQYVITISGKIKVEVPSGEQRIYGAGQVTLVAEDPNAYGHNTTVISEEPWRCVFLPLAKQPYLDQ